MTVDRLAPPLLVLLSDLVRATFGSRTRLIKYRIANQRLDYLVLLADLVHPTLRVSIKLAGPQAPHVYPFDRLAMLHRLVRAHTTIPMADIIAVDTSYVCWPWQYLIKTYIAGEEWASVRDHLDSQQRRDVYRQIGQAVAELHSIQFPAFGELAADGDVQGGGDLLSALTHRAETSIQSPRLRDLFFAVVEQHAFLFTDVQPARLCHDDLHGQNILMWFEQEQWQIATILDFDKAWAGHHESDLARLELWSGMIGEGFWEQYAAMLPAAALYPQRRPLYQLLWCLEYAESTPKHLADTAHVCQQLGLPAIERFD